MENMWLSHTQLPHLPLYTIVTKPRAQTSRICFIFLQCLRLKRLIVLESLQQTGKGAMFVMPFCSIKHNYS